MVRHLFLLSIFASFISQAAEPPLVKVRLEAGTLSDIKYFQKKQEWQSDECSVKIVKGKGKEKSIGFEELNAIFEYFKEQGSPMTLQLMRDEWRLKPEVIRSIKSLYIKYADDEDFNNRRLCDQTFVKLSFEPSLPYEVLMRPYDFTGQIQHHDSYLLELNLSKRFFGTAISMQEYTTFCSALYALVFAK